MYKIGLIYIAVILFADSTLCQQPELPPEFNDIQNKLNEIPGLGNNAPTIEEIIEAAQKKCEENGGKEAFDRLMVAKDEIQECFQSNFNLTHIEGELNEKRKNGSMDEVFAKYCKKRPIIEACLKNLTNAVEPCLEESEKSSVKLLVSITENFIDFGCYKDGDRLAMFLAEGGLECVKNKSAELESCANKTLSHRIPANFALTSVPLLVFNNDGCQDYFNLQSCVVSTLEGCSDHTSANLVDAMFKFIRRSTPCKDYKQPSSTLGRSNRRVIRDTTNNPELSALLQAYDKLKQKYEPHCLQNGGSKARNEFQEGLVQVEKCQKTVQTNFMRKLEEVRGFAYDYMCKDFRYGLRGCLSNLTTKMEACSSRAEKYVPKFGLEIYDSLFNYQCKDEARALKMVLGEQDYCMKTILSSTDVCIGKTKHIRDYSKEAVVTKSELCSDLKLLKNCFVDMASQKCPGNTNINDLVKGFTDSIYAPCSSCNLTISLLLTLILILLTKVF
ncbi:hypothetical protein RN001_011436 [Aquatica leii]|uniref:Uncharacterized protein n=1 Tax=Aquatica leii TaxID=1421715 RepID=A0AAN7PRR5_9COLE|nr:hypothetical protein RN001_011436 [Aquatica leii]